VSGSFLANVDATDERRKNESTSRRWLKYPLKDKKFFLVYWPVPVQAVSYDVQAKRLEEVYRLAHRWHSDIETAQPLTVVVE
jgi:hypothetical protein